MEEEGSNILHESLQAQWILFSQIECAKCQSPLRNKEDFSRDLLASKDTDLCQGNEIQK